MGSKEEHRKSRNIVNEMKSAVRPGFDCELYKRIELREMTKDFITAKKIKYEAQTEAEYPFDKMVSIYSEKLGLDINGTIAWLAAEEAKQFADVLNKITPIEEPVQE